MHIGTQLICFYFIFDSGVWVCESVNFVECLHQIQNAIIAMVHIWKFIQTSISYQIYLTRFILNNRHLEKSNFEYFLPFNFHPGFLIGENSVAQKPKKKK